MSTIKVFIGTELGKWLPTEVLKHSIRRRTKADVVFHETRFFPMNIKIPRHQGAPIDRFFVPEVCEYEGKAIYLDPTMLVQGDIEELFNQSMNEKGALALPIDSQRSGYFTNVMLLNCAQLKSWSSELFTPLLTQDPMAYTNLYWVRPNLSISSKFGPLPSEWLSIDNADPTTKLIYFHQDRLYPWKRPGHPLRRVYLDELAHAVKDQAIPLDAIEREIRWKYASQGILREIS